MEHLYVHKIKIIKDKYRRLRGGYSELLRIVCSSCKNEILIYQKDGPGILKRMYLDRIHFPEELKKLQYINIKKIEPLKCSTCDRTIAIPYIYKKEKRKIFRLFVGAIIKEKI